MEEQLTAFLDFLRSEQNYSQNTIAAYQNDLGQYLRFIQSQPQIDKWSDITAEVVEAYVAELKKKAYASSSIARKVAAVKSFSHYLFARDVISSDPTKLLESPKVSKRKPQTLSIDEVDRLLQSPKHKNTPKNLRDAALLGVLYATGMRVTEVVSLRTGELDLEKSQLNCMGKDGHQRNLPIDDTTNSLLARYLDKGRPYLVKNGNEEEALFLNHRGQQLTRQGLWLIIKAYARQAKLNTPVTPHTLRHSFAAHKLSDGSNLQEVQQLLGHANISTTQIYTQLDRAKVEVA